MKNRFQFCWYVNCEAGMTLLVHAEKGTVHEAQYWLYRERKGTCYVNTDDYLTNTL